MTAPVASIHYHLRPGGVTEVIRHNHRILSAAGIAHTILCGDNPSTLPATVDPAFDYAPAAAMENGAAPAAFKPSRFPPALLHFHNPCLGKNPALTACLRGLAENGHALLLQHHDLAGDDRPGLLAALRGVPCRYPVSPRIGHAFINSRDLERFVRAGLPADRAFLLPNPFTLLPLPPPAAGGPATVLLPMRGIPRKNLAEFLLLAASAPPGSRFLQGSAPDNPAWLENYEIWRRFADTLGPRVHFDVFAEGRIEAMAASTHFATTSTHEGFGLIHLEAAGSRRVIGRRIPSLAADLAGFPDSGLYEAILIDGADFPTLAPVQQQEVIARAAAGDTSATVIQQGKPRPLRSWLADQLERRQPEDAPAALARHSDAAHLGRLTHIARVLLDSPAGPVRALDPAAIETEAS